MEALVELVGVYAGYGRRLVLRGVSLSLGGRTYCVVVGGNGSGKTTLLRVAAGVLPPRRGSVRILGADPFHAYSVRRRVGYIPVRGLPCGVRVGALLRWYCGLLGCRWGEAEWLLEELGVDQLLGLDCCALSTGQQRRVLYALGLMCGRRVVLVDEPLSGLDAGAARTVSGLLRSVAREGGVVVAATHSLEGVDADYIVVLTRGRVLYAGGFEGLEEKLKLLHVESLPARIASRLEALGCAVMPGERGASIACPREVADEALEALGGRGVSA